VWVSRVGRAGVRRLWGVSPEERIVELEALVARQAALIEAQAETIVRLEARIVELEAQSGRNSGNSSLPPSRDNRDRRVRRAEEREQRKQARRDGAGETGRAPGKQPGAPGMTMRRRHPDITIVHRPVACGNCAADLTDATVIGSACRQVVDIPQPRLVVTDHVAEKRRCSCGHVAAGVFPPEATGPTCWGPRVKAAAVYLLIRQHIPFERAHEAMDALFAAPVSEGTLCAWTLDAAERLAPFLDELKALLLASPVVCADETPIRVGTGKSYVHTVSTDTLTLLVHHAGRGIEAIIDAGVLDNYRGVIMHDGLATYDCAELAAADHAQCHAHLDRHLIDVGTWVKYKPWCENMRQVLVDAQRANREARTAGLAAVPSMIAAPIRARYLQVIAEAFEIIPHGPPPPKKQSWKWGNQRDRDAYNLATRFRVETDQILRLLDNTAVPASNNNAERSLRMCKIHDKIAGLFRSATHAAAFCTIRSYIQTGNKHHQPSLDLLQRLYTGPAWLPTG
jgi:transposase